MGAAADTAQIRPLAARGNAASPQAGSADSKDQGGGIFFRVLKFFAALALIPGCVGLTLAAHEYLRGVWMALQANSSAAPLPATMLHWFLIGAGTFAILAVLLWRPVVVYVFAHELVHALAAWMCLAKVSNLQASATGGQVTTSKSNTFIRLAPYCVPLYALLAALVYLGLNTWWRPLHAHVHYMAAALGFFYTFHVGFTLWSLRHDQPDLKPDGWLFSLVVIYIFNLLIFVALIGFLMDPQPKGAWPALRDCSIAGWHRASDMYRNLSLLAGELIGK